MTTVLEGGSGIRIITDEGAGTYPAYQPGRKITLAKTVGGFSAAAIFGIPPSEAAGALLNGSQLGSFIWNGVQFCRCPDSGSGSGFEIYLLNSTGENTQHRYNATEPGKSGETPPREGTTNQLAQGFTDATGYNAIRVVKPAFWNGPGEYSQVAALALNMREVSEMINTITYTWGLAGNDHILQMDQSIVIPTDPVVQAYMQLSLVPYFNYCPNFGAKPFTTQEWVDLTTGATRAYAGDVSTTEVLMNKTADDAFACAQVFGAGMLGGGSVDAERGYRGSAAAGAFPFVNTYAWCAKVYGSGIPAGTVRAPVGFCFGTRADLIGGSGAIVTAAANLPAASYPA